MRRTYRGSLRGATAPLIALTLMLGACTGGAAEPTASGAPAGTNDTLPGGGASPTTAPDPGTDVPAAAPGEAVMVVEGKTLTFTMVNTCDLDVEDGFSFNVIAADGVSDMRAGGGGSAGDWFGQINVFVDAGESGIYTADLSGEGRTIVIEGDRLSYAGPISFKPPTTGDNPTSRPVGEGTIAVNCT